MENGTTLKQLKFVKKYIENNGNGTKAALDSYETSDVHTAHQIAYENLRKPAVIQELKRNLEKLGLSDEFLDGSIREIIESGLVNKERSLPADALTAIEMVNKLKDRFPATKNVNLNANLYDQYRDKSTPELKQMMREIQVENRKLLIRL